MKARDGWLSSRSEDSRHKRAQKRVENSVTKSKGELAMVGGFGVSLVGVAFHNCPKFTPSTYQSLDRSLPVPIGRASNVQCMHRLSPQRKSNALDRDSLPGKARRSGTPEVRELSGFHISSHAVKKPESSPETEEALSSPLDQDSVLELAAEERSFGKKLFSNLNQVTLQHEPGISSGQIGSLSGSILLVAGTTVGAGILAIPAVTQDAGFLPSAATCVACWSYMVATGLLVAEVNINTMCELGSGGVSLVSMAFRTLGQGGVRVACVTYLFIHYALLVAYVARSSEIVSTAIGWPLWLSGCLFTGTLGALCFFSSQRVINIVNGILVGGIITTFATLVGVVGRGLEIEAFSRINWMAVPQSIPIIALSFVYQNVVPVICTSLEGDPPKIRAAIVLGTSIPLVMFLAWDAVILGSIHFDPNNITQNLVDPLLSLRSSNGVVGPVVELFSLLAIATSYIGFVLGLSDFLSDLLKLPSVGSKRSLPLLLTLLPPLALALTSPNIFFDALDFAGTYGVLVLFGILPAAMAWSERYSGTCLPPSSPPLVPGGRLTLIAIVGLAGLVICSELGSYFLP